MGLTFAWGLFIQIVECFPFCYLKGLLIITKVSKNNNKNLLHLPK